MKFLEISPNVLVNLQSVDAIEIEDDVRSKVYVGTRVFETFIPFSTLIGMLKMSQESSSPIEEMASDIRNLRENSQTFSG